MYITNKERKKMIRMLKDKAMIKMLDDVKERIGLFEEEMDASISQIRSLKQENISLRQMIQHQEWLIKELQANNKMLQEELDSMPQTIFDYYTDIVDMDDVEENILELSKTYYEVMNYLTNID